MKILDATCGMRSIWFEKNHPFVTYLDIRNGDYIYQDKKKKHKPKIYHIKPDVVADWTKKIPFEDNYFDMVVFDPPHVVCNIASGDMIIRYGHLTKNNWEYVLKKGVIELFRVLKTNGVFILKFAETKNLGFKIPLKNVISFFPYPPLFGTRTGNSNNNHWIVFLKYDVNRRLGT